MVLVAKVDIVPIGLVACGASVAICSAPTSGAWLEYLSKASQKDLLATCALELACEERVKLLSVLWTLLTMCASA